MNERSDTLLHPRDVARAFGSASDTYDGAARLQAQVRAELLSRLDVLRQAPAAVLDLGAGTGLAAVQLKRRYRTAAVTAADLARPMLDVARQRSRFWRRFQCVEADARALPFDDASFDVVFTNLMLQWVQPLDAALVEIRRVLRPGGVLLASSLGPQTLQELRAAWAIADGATHVNAFVDMHDFGSALSRAGFIEPVLDVDRHVYRYADVHTLMRELKAIGAHNVNAGRSRGLMGKAALSRMTAAYETLRGSAGLPATWQVVYAVAWADREMPDAPAGRLAGEVAIGMDSLRASLAKWRR